MPNIPIQDPDIQEFDRLFRKAERKTALQQKAKRLMVGQSHGGQWIDGKWIEFIDPEKERIMRLAEQQKPGEFGV